MEYETPLDHLRPVSASNKKMDVGSVMDYNEIISGMGGQGPHMTPDMDEQRHLEPPPAQYDQRPPQIAHIDEQSIQQALIAQQMRPKEQPKKTEEFKDNSIISETDQRDFIYLIIVIAILFSESSQNYLCTLIPSLFRDGKTTLVGLVFNAFVVIFGLVLIRKVKVSI